MSKQETFDLTGFPITNPDAQHHARNIADAIATNSLARIEQDHLILPMTETMFSGPDNPYSCTVHLPVILENDTLRAMTKLEDPETKELFDFNDRFFTPDDYDRLQETLAGQDRYVTSFPGLEDNTKPAFKALIVSPHQTPDPEERGRITFETSPETGQHGADIDVHLRAANARDDMALRTAVSDTQDASLLILCDNLRLSPISEHDETQELFVYATSPKAVTVFEQDNNPMRLERKPDPFDLA